MFSFSLIEIKFNSLVVLVCTVYLFIELNNAAENTKWMEITKKSTKHKPIVRRTAHQLAYGIQFMWRKSKDLSVEKSNTLTPDATHTYSVTIRSSSVKSVSPFDDQCVYINVYLCGSSFLLLLLFLTTREWSWHRRAKPNEFQVSFCKQI